MLKFILNYKKNNQSEFEINIVNEIKNQIKDT
jgi:hypothetical protein